MTGCFVFGHKWKHKRRISKDVRWLDMVNDMRMATMWKEDFFDIYRCEYCKTLVQVPVTFKPDNTRREKWEAFSLRVKAILK